MRASPLLLGSAIILLAATSAKAQIGNSSSGSPRNNSGLSLVAATNNPNLTAFSDEPYYGGANDWNLNEINAPEVWARGYNGSGIVVAVIDSGVDYRHSELVDNIWVNTGEVAGNRRDDDGNGYVDDVRGWDFAHNDTIRWTFTVMAPMSPAQSRRQEMMPARQASPTVRGSCRCKFSTQMELAAATTRWQRRFVTP